MDELKLETEKVLYATFGLELVSPHSVFEVRTGGGACGQRERDIPPPKLRKIKILKRIS